MVELVSRMGASGYCCSTKLASLIGLKTIFKKRERERETETETETERGDSILWLVFV